MDIFQSIRKNILMAHGAEFLTTEEVQQVYSKVHELKKFWTPRSKQISDLDDMEYYSIGAASYLDARPGDESYYHELLATTNQVIEREFGWLLEKLLKCIEREMGKPAVLHSKFAYPGFQIYGTDWFFEDYMGPKHCDHHYKFLDWGDLKFDPKDNLSYTAAIKLPANGGGVYFWDHYFIDDESKTIEEGFEKMFTLELKDEDRQFHAYHEGGIFFHSGNLMHQIAPMQDIQEGDERITLQGHAVLSEDLYHLFW